MSFSFQIVLYNKITILPIREHDAYTGLFSVVTTNTIYEMADLRLHISIEMAISTAEQFL